MDLIDYIYAVLPDLGRDAYHLSEVPYIIHRVVGRSIQFVYAV